MNQVVPAVKRNLDLSENRPIKEAVYEALRKTILLGEIPSGERINEKNLSGKSQYQSDTDSVCA